MRMLGLSDDDYTDDDKLELLPDNLQVVAVFSAMRTQWLVGPGGVYGLNYVVLPEIWRRTKIAPADRDEIFSQLRTMEAAALESFQNKSKKAN